MSCVLFVMHPDCNVLKTHKQVCLPSFCPFSCIVCSLFTTVQGKVSSVRKVTLFVSHCSVNSRRYSAPCNTNTKAALFSSIDTLQHQGSSLLFHRPADFRVVLRNVRLSQLLCTNTNTSKKITERWALTAK